MKANRNSRLRDNLLKALAVSAVAAVPAAAFAPTAFAAGSNDPDDYTYPTDCNLRYDQGNYTTAAGETKHSRGWGTPNDPFIINDEVDLQEINDCVVDDEYFYYVLAQDIELDSDAGYWWNDDDYGWTPLGDYDNSGDYFTGNFNGNGHTISGLEIWADDDYAGLFGYAEDATIKNLTVEGYIDGNTYTYVGGLAGELYDVVVTNVHTNVEIIDAYDYAGGIAGYMDYSSIARSSSEGSVIAEGEAYQGGIVGYADYSVLNRVTSSSEVNEVDNLSDGNDYVGGIAGYTDYTSISNATFSGSATGYLYVGGIVGYTDNSALNNLEVTEDALVQAESEDDVSYFGGIVGYDYYSPITDASFAGELDAAQHSDYDADQVGGIVGYIYTGTVANSVVTDAATITVDGTSYDEGEWTEYIGGLAGYAEYGVSFSNSHNHADLDVSDAEYVGGLVGYAEYGINISGSSNTGDVTVALNNDANDYYAGLVAYAYDGVAIDNSVNKGDVVVGGETDSYSVGGLIGYSEYGVSVSDSYNLGYVEGTYDVAGLIGFVDDDTDDETDINTSYNAGFVNALDGDQDGIANGAWDESKGTSNVVLDTQASIGTYTNAVEADTTEVKDAAFLANLGWSIDEDGAVWAVDAEFQDGYPHLAWEYSAAEPGAPEVPDMVFSTLFFGNKSRTTLTLNAQAYLTQVADVIKAGDYTMVEIDGFTPRTVKNKVARARTAAVKQFLMDEGVSTGFVIHNLIHGPGHLKNTVVVTALG